MDGTTATIVFLLGAVVSQAITGVTYLIVKKKRTEEWERKTGVDQDTDFKV